MGLDMYLNGRKYLWENWEKPEANQKEDGFVVNEKILKLGYWRKHPNLHGYIVQTFANGEDNCQDIDLYADDLRNIIAAVKAGKLPETEGFFFGTSENSEAQRKEDLKILRGALKWLEGGEDAPKPKKVEDVGFATLTTYEPATTKWPKESRYVVYRASW